MELPQYKEWMGESSRVGQVYVNGVNDFVKYAKKNLKTDIIPCPCIRCRNGKRLKGADVNLHLIQWGMQGDYTFWKFHGERDFPYMPEEIIVKETIHTKVDPLVHARLNDLINVADDMQKLSELKSSQGSSSQTGLDSDALTAFKGKDTRGVTRGVGPASKIKLKAIAPIVSQVNRAKTREEKYDEDMAFLKSSINILLSAFESNGLKLTHAKKYPMVLNHQFSPQHSTNQFSPQHFERDLNDSPHLSPHDYTLVPPSYPSNLQDSTEPDFQSSKSLHDPYVELLDFSSTRKIASGQVVVSATTGTVVQDHRLLQFERKVYVSSVDPGEENHPLYRNSHGRDITLKEVEKSWVVWPLFCLSFVDPE